MIFFQANHSINHQNQLYFISVFIYTCIKVKLTKGEKKRLRQSQTEPYLQTFFFGCKRIRNPNQKESKVHLLSSHKKTTQKSVEESVNFSLILQSQSAKLSPICLIFAKRRFRGERERFSPFSLCFEAGGEEKC